MNHLDAHLWKSKTNNGHKRIKDEISHNGIMANRSEADIITHFLTSLIELIFIKQETWSFQ